MAKNNMIITKKTWEELRQNQAELGELIMLNRQKSEPDSEPDFLWVSLFNAERLKLCLLVEAGELANEIKSFKAWRKKQKVDWDKVKEELIDCLCFFLDLSNLFQVELVDFSFPTGQQELHFNKLLLDFFVKTNDLSVLEKEELYNSEKIKITNQKTYQEWLETFQVLCAKLAINEPELKAIYLRKHEKNKLRAEEKDKFSVKGK